MTESRPLGPTVRHPPVRAADPAAVSEAARAVRQGRLVAFPTETVYGLGADATDDRAVARVFAAKGRPQFNPLIVHLPETVAAAALVRFDDRAAALAAAFWPGALTLVLPRRPDCPVSRLASAGLDSLAVRVPDHPLALALLRAAGRPLAAPSANPSGGVSPTTADHVAAAFTADQVAVVLDGGRCRVGIESTVVGLTGEGPALLRPGGVSAEAIEAVVGPLTGTALEEDRAPRSPGRLTSHYAPSRPLRLSTSAPRPGEALLAFGPDPPGGFAAVRNLSPAGDLVEAAANLFAMLHDLDRREFTGIAAMTVPDRGLGRAINDRLRRAAAAKRG